MSVLKDKRTELRDALEQAGFFAFSTVPEQANPPLVFVAPSEPYVSLEGASFGGHAIVHHQITIVAPTGVNEKTANDLDDLLEGVLPIVSNLVDTYYVDRPGTTNEFAGGQLCLAVSIETQTEIQLEGS